MRIAHPNDLAKRSYISFYLDGKRIRIYNGKCLGIRLFPNRASSAVDKEKMLVELRGALVEAIKNNKYPVMVSSSVFSSVENDNKGIDGFSIASCLDAALAQKNKSGLSFHYLKNLRSVISHFKAFLSDQELSGDIRSLSARRVQEFLDRYNTSGTNYMNRRTELGAILALISRQIGHELKIIQLTEPMKRKAKLHQIYEGMELKQMLDFLKRNNENLYLCCLICYGCFLRPHREIRCLKVSQIKNDCTEIHLSGAENKTGRIRIVYLPEYLSVVLRQRILGLAEDVNIFSQRKMPFNRSYFHTHWQRLKNLMRADRVILPGQTMYSFRHTAAVNVYRETKDVSIVQRLMGHSDMMVTMHYLRSLAEGNEEHLRVYLPKL